MFTGIKTKHPAAYLERPDALFYAIIWIVL
jgi:hypothetical protein